MIKNILLIDDDISISDVIHIFFEEQGFNVKNYTDGANLDKKMREFSPDLILLDFLLPNKNGAQIAKEVRKILSTTKHLPIIMISANKIYKKEAKAAGVDEFIEKPFDLYELLNVVNRYLKIPN